MIPHDVLVNIRRNDPDGGEVEPTNDKYEAFEKWVLNTYGSDVWDAYMNGETYESPHNENGTSDDFYG